MLRAELAGGPPGPPIDVALAVEPGHCISLAGPSGAGKSTILRMLAGLSQPSAGFVRLGERTLFDSARGVNLAPEERGVGMVFQEYALFDHMSAWQNVAFGLRGRRRRAEKRAAAIELLARFGIEGLADDPAARLSGGERQRVALARAVAAEPAALLLDEPLAALDVRTAAAAAQELALLVKELGVPAVLVTHEFLEAALLGDQIAVLEAGEIRQLGTAAELAAEPAAAFVADFTGANILTGTAQPVSPGMTGVELDGGGRVLSADAVQGKVAVAIQPWDVMLRIAADDASGSSARNELSATISSITPVGGRLRIGLLLPQPLAVEITEPARRELKLEPGKRVTAVFKASATRLFAR
jgi:molybdate transport system ATP-binding protein